MKLHAVIISNNEAYDNYTDFVGVFTSFDKVREGVHKHATANGWTISHEYHPQLGDYRGENPDVLCFVLEDYGYEYVTIETELELDERGE
jgi:hypothetical protein